jgi:RNA polymerase sigma factor (sigma-70 family)
LSKKQKNFAILTGERFMKETTVLIQGRAYRWNAIDGLDPSAALTVEHWIKRVAMQYLGKANLLHYDLEDLIQAGFIGALLAAKSFLPAAGCKYLSWAKFGIRKQIQVLCKTKSTFGLDDNAEDENTPCINDFYAQLDAELDVKRLLCGMPNKDKRLLTQRFGLGRDKRSKSLEELARLYKVSPNTINSRIMQVLYNIKQQLSKKHN